MGENSKTPRMRCVDFKPKHTPIGFSQPAQDIAYWVSPDRRRSLVEFGTDSFKKKSGGLHTEKGPCIPKAVKLPKILGMNAEYRGGVGLRWINLAE